MISPAATLFILLLAAQVSANPVTLKQSTKRSGPIVLCAFAGGGFGSSSTKKNTTKKKDKKKRGGLILEDFQQSRDERKVSIGQQEPELDRFGLPIRTAENFFPPLSQDVEIIGMDHQDTTLSIIREAMVKHVPLNYDLFDDNAVEKMVYRTGNNEKPWKLKLLHKSPPVLEIENFFTAQECQEYIDIASATEKKSGKHETNSSLSPLQVSSKTFSTLAHSRRTSTTWFCHFCQVPTFLAKTKRLLNNISVKQMEEAQIVRYRTGEEFTWHYDEIPSAQLANGGQRIATLLVYLNSIQKGGGTIFRDLKDATGLSHLTMQPKQGSALLFFPAFVDGTPDDRTLHKGEIAVEEKMIAQMWIHEREYTPVTPEGNNHEDALNVIKEKEIELGYNTNEIG